MSSGFFCVLYRQIRQPPHQTLSFCTIHWVHVVCGKLRGSVHSVDGLLAGSDVREHGREALGGHYDDVMDNMDEV